QQAAWHNAADDVDTLYVIFCRLMNLCLQSGLPLPYASNHAQAGASFPTVRAPKVTSPWAAVTDWTPGSRLTQGAKFAVTGGTSAPREEIYVRSVTAGLIPMNSVSRRTALVVCNSGMVETTKLRDAREAGVPVITERTFEDLLSDLAPGTPVGSAVPRPAAAPAPRGPLTGARVLVLGGPHDVAADVRDRVTAAGGRVAVNHTPTVSHVVMLDGAERDSRWQRASALPQLSADSLTELTGVPGAQTPGPTEEEPGSAAVHVPVAVQEVPGAVVLRRGIPLDLPAAITNWEVFVGWTLVDPPWEIDVVAMVVDADERVLTDQHLVYFGSLATPDGAVRLDVDTAGEAEVAVDLDEVPGRGVKAMLAAVISGGATFGDVGPLEVVIRDAVGAEAARATLDAGTVERSMLIAEFYRRGEGWRIKPIGQGYEDDLRAFVERHGVQVAD
ncbi:MAG: TerD family protein, partial [Gordonia polyisoprenivorans]|nr:TerD family protein [Gordonia polyisoprenivorans]